MVNDKYDSQSGKGFKKIFKNFSLLTAGKVSGDFFTFILFVILSRKYGHEGIGQYSFAVGLTGLFAICADFGLYSFTVKEISRHKNDFEKYFQKIFSLRVVQSSIVLILLFIITPFLPFSFETKIIISIIGTYLIIYSVIDGLSAVFVAHEQMSVTARIEVGLKIITSCSAILIALMGGSIIFALIMLPLLSVFQLIIVIGLVRKKIGRIKFLFNSESLLNTGKQTLPFGISEVLYTLFARIDIILIGFLISESSAGLYNVGYRVVFFLLFIPRFASFSLFPIISRLFFDSKFEFQKMYNKALSMIIIVGLPIVAGLWLISSELIGFVFGPNFRESADVLKILSGLFFLYSLNNMMEIFLMASDHQSERTKGQFYATITSIILNVILILLYGIKGAAIAVMLSSFFLTVIYIIKLKSIIGLPDIILKLLISSIGVLTFLLFFYFIPAPLFIVVPISIIIYILTIMLFGNVRNNELRMVLDLIRKK